MTVMHVERLSLRLPGFRRDEADRLARLVAEGLSRAVPSRDAEAVRVEVKRKGGDSLTCTADQIVAEVLRQLA